MMRNAVMCLMVEWGERDYVIRLWTVEDFEYTETRT